ALVSLVYGDLLKRVSRGYLHDSAFPIWEFPNPAYTNFVPQLATPAAVLSLIIVGGNRPNLHQPYGDMSMIDERQDKSLFWASITPSRPDAFVPGRKFLKALTLSFVLASFFVAEASGQTTWTLVWNDEFNAPKGALPDPSK